jgi:peptide/nickel transport system permease protein
MRSLRYFLSRRQNWLGLLIILSFTFVALAAPVLSPPNQKTEGVFKRIGLPSDNTPHPPSREAILGTLPGQIDVYHTLVWGAREAMQFGLLVSAGAFIFGALFGAVAGYVGGIINSAMMRIADTFLAFPILAGVVFLQQLVAVTIESMGGIYWFNSDRFGKLVYFEFTPPPFAAFLLKVDPVLVSLILFSWMPIARLVNVMVITLKNADFVQSARALGGSLWWVISRHLLPNAIGPAIVIAARNVGGSVILQATITVIGLGGQSAWGILLSRGRDWVIGPGGNMFATWWVFLPVTLALMLFDIGWNLIGDGLMEALEPSAVIYKGSFFSKLRSKRVKIDMPVSTIPHPLNSVGNLKPPTIPSATSLRSPMGRLTEKDPLLQVARDAIVEQNIDQAMHAYSHLIKHRKHVSEIRQDLVRIVRQFPRHSIVWTLLGDALTQEGNCEYANKAYEQARNLTQ